MNEIMEAGADCVWDTSHRPTFTGHKSDRIRFDSVSWKNNYSAVLFPVHLIRFNRIMQYGNTPAV